MVSAETLISVYKNKKIFLTGHTGFKGIWLSAIMRRLGATVCGYSLAPDDSEPFFSLFNDGQLANKNIIADIRNIEALQSAILAFQPDFIFHLAAQPLVLKSYEIPAETFSVNVTGTANLLESVSKLQKKCTIVVITTDKVYENKESDLLYTEQDVLGGYDPYSASKACTEIVVSAFRNSFFNVKEFQTHQKAIATARAGNVIGGGDWSKNRIIPDTAKALINSEPIILRNPSAIRPWQHVLEPLFGYLLLGANLNESPALFSEPFNFGPLPSDHLTVKELTELFIKSWGKGEIQILPNNNPPHEANLLKLDINKAFTKMNWKPKLNATEAIAWTAEWYKTEAKEQDAITFEQIENYITK